MIEKATEIVTGNDPATDLWPQFRQANANYKKKRSEILEPLNLKPVQVGKYTKKRVKRTIPSHNPLLLPKAESEKQDSFKHTIPDEDICILWPLSSALQVSLPTDAADAGVVIQNGQASKFRSNLYDLLSRGEVLYEYAVRAVLRISPDVVVKIHRSSDTTELQVLDHINGHSHQIPVPNALGMIKIGAWCYIFTSFIHGISLGRVWGNLTSDRKCHVREQLNHLFTELRQLPLPSREGHLGGGVPLMCKASHRHTKTSSVPIINEAQFNDFLLDNSLLGPARLEHIHTNLSSDHQIFMTHGDLCLVNILVDDESTLRITGIIDWETGGAYLEYWEYVKAFKSFNSRDDRCLYLPEGGIGRYFDEYTNYNIIGAVLIRVMLRFTVMRQATKMKQILLQGLRRMLELY